MKLENLFLADFQLEFYNCMPPIYICMLKVQAKFLWCYLYIYVPLRRLLLKNFDRRNSSNFSVNSFFVPTELKLRTRLLFFILQITKNW